MSLVIHLLGRPRVESTRGEPYRFRSRKSWPLLAYLLLAERPRSRAQLAGLIFAKAQTYLGSVASDRGDYPRAVGLLVDAQSDAAESAVVADTSVLVGELLRSAGRTRLVTFERSRQRACGSGLPRAV